ncbi:MAG: hypothetical protein Q4C25_05745 [Bacillota bacterium]|nr:hypothetical protein [Bacillota bacterium]
MDISIYIANESIQYVKGRERNGIIRVEEAEKFPLTEGAVMNGLITDEDLLIKSLADFMLQVPVEDEKSVRLAIGSSHVFTKTMVVPHLPERKMLKWIEGEFIDVLEDEEEEMLYDYAILDSQKEEQYAILCAVRKSLIGAYADIFKNTFDVKLKSIDMGLNCQIKLMEEVNPEDDTFITLLLDGSTLAANLYVTGLFKISNRIRLLSERGSEGLSDEISRVVSNLIQFNETEKNGEAVSKIYLFGSTPDESFLLTDIRETFGMDPITLKVNTGIVETDLGDFVLDDYTYAVGNLIRK